MSLLKDCLKGIAVAGDIDIYMEKWNSEAEHGVSLSEYLGLTEDEAERFLIKNELTFKEIVQKHAQDKIDSLVKSLNEASKAYYSGFDEIMSNYIYDKIYDELLDFEARFSYEPEDSPTRRVGYEVESSLEKIVHEYKALSLDKTKSQEDLKTWLKDELGILSWKLDGLTLQLTYDNGTLTRAVTRGNGEIGEDITHNAKHIKGVKKEVPFKGHLVIRGEAYISYTRFNQINQNLPVTKRYKNPRNLASGSVRQLDSKEAARRHVEFKAFELVYAENEPYLENNVPDAKVTKLMDTYATRFSWLKEQGFDVVEFYIVGKDTLVETIEKMEKQIANNDFPSDGLVLSYNDIAYGKSLGVTGKYPKHSIAFKWKDDIQETKLQYVEWSASRTGLINPVAVFNPVEIEGTTVSRASIHNVSIMKTLKLGKGDTITVYKANMIIPQIAENLTQSGTEVVPETCPVCGSPTVIKESTNDGQLVQVLYCTNPDCQIKHIKKFAHFVKRDQMDISGLSEATIEKLVGLGLIKEYRDIYHLCEHKDEIIALEGFGEKSYEKLINAVEKSRKVKLEKLIASFGIDGVGRDVGKKVSKMLGGDIDEFNKKLETGDFTDIEGVGDINNAAINAWYQLQKSRKETGDSEYFNLLKELKVETSEKKADSDDDALSGKTFVITGDLHVYENRAALVAKIESLGGKTSGSVSKKTSYLINNDTTSNSSKNKKAKELGIPILSEEDFLKLLNL